VEPNKLHHLNSCPICNSSILGIYLRADDYFLTHEHFKIDACNNCGFRFTNPRPSKQDIFRYYESVDYISHSNIQSGILNKIYHFVRTFTLKSKNRIIGNYFKSGNLLDIGCGSGEFLNNMQKNHFIVTGIEPNNGARIFAREYYKLNVFDEVEIENLKASTFEVITMWHVLEHVYYLEERIKQIQNLLSQDGILVVAVPNSSSWDAKHYGKYWAAFDLPRHLYHFETSSIKNLFEKYGFKLVKIKPMFFDAFYISLLSEKYKTGKLNYILGIFNGFISNSLALLNKKNYSSLIYIFKYK